MRVGRCAQLAQRERRRSAGGWFCALELLNPVTWVFAEKARLLGEDGAGIRGQEQHAEEAEEVWSSHGCFSTCRFALLACCFALARCCASAKQQARGAKRQARGANYFFARR